MGPKKRVFKIHKRLLCDSFQYFKATFEGHFKEGNEQLLELLDEDVSVFEQFQLWTYSGTISLAGSEVTENQKILLGLYVFGDKRGITQLQNDAIDYFIDNVCENHVLSRSLTSWAYENTAPTSPLRRLFVDVVVHWCLKNDGSTWFDRESQRYPQEYLLAIARGLCERLHKRTPKITDFRLIRSNYHI